MSYDCIIIGAGISGLSLAYELKKAGQRVLLLEASARVGGAINSDLSNEGFVLESGPNTVVSKDPALWQHFSELGIEDQRLVARPTSSKRYVLRNGQLSPLPMGPGSFFRTPLLTRMAKLRIFAEPIMPRAPTSDESVAAFFSRRVGMDITQQFVDPFVSGVYAGDPDQLSIRAAFPRMWEAEQRGGSLIRGMLTAPRPKRAKGQPRPKNEMFNFERGLSTWTEALGAALGDAIWLNTRATKVQEQNGTWAIQVERQGEQIELSSRRLVIATPADVAADLIGNLDYAAANALRAIPYPPVIIVHLGYRRDQVEHPLDGFGMLCPIREKRRVLGVLWPSSLFPGRAPEGMLLTSSFLAGARRPEQAKLSEAELIELAVADHRELVGAKGDPVLARVFVAKRAIPQYTIGHLSRIAAVERMEAAHSGLHLLANYRGGISVPQCWTNACALAEQIVQEA
jgi:oxygen-dependent protoporphyrinogen oxidase